MVIVFIKGGNLKFGFRREIRDFGVKVSIIEPGSFKTRMTDAELIIEKTKKTWEATPEHIRESYGQQFFDDCKLCVCVCGGGYAVCGLCFPAHLQRAEVDFGCHLLLSTLVPSSLPPSPYMVSLCSPGCPGNLLCRPSWPRTHRGVPTLLPMCQRWLPPPLGSPQ